MPVPNPANGYIPKVGERVRIVGHCHPRCLGKVVEVTEVYQDKEGLWNFGERHYSALDGGLCYGGGYLGGVEPVPADTPLDCF